MVSKKMTTDQDKSTDKVQNKKLYWKIQVLFFFFLVYQIHQGNLDVL